jgi:tRNA C32,U32 (ribose-2'-O)-methylase TrmJ
VQIICYEILLAAGAGNITPENDAPPASAGQMQKLYEQLENSMTSVGFLNPRKPRLLMRRVKRLFNRAQLDQNEINILLGFLAAVREYIRKDRA